MRNFRPSILFGPYSEGMAGQPTIAEKWFERFAIVVFVPLVMFRDKSPWLYLAALCFMPTSILFYLLFVREWAKLRESWMQKVVLCAVPVHCLILAAIIRVWIVYPVIADRWFFGVIVGGVFAECCLVALLFLHFRPKTTTRV